MQKKRLQKKCLKRVLQILQDDPTKNAIKEIMALRVRDAMAKHAPEAAKLNKEVSELILVKNAMEEAEKRFKNRDFLDLTNKIAAGGGLATAATSPETAAAAAAFILLRKAASRGKGASTLIRAGKGIKKMPAPKVFAPGAGGVAQTLGKTKKDDEEKTKKRIGTLGRHQ